LTDIARRRNLKLLFDSSHAFGCTYKGRHAGGYGNAEVFSFHATKYLNTIEGGAITTNDSDLAKKIRLMKNFGFTNYDQTDYIGINGKMNEFSAAMGLTNMESMDEFVQTNIRNYRCYEHELKDIPGVSLTQYDQKEKSNYQYIVLEIDRDKSGASRDQLLKTLHANNILARRYFYPGCHRMQPYRAFFPHAGLLLPETEILCRKVLCLPTGTSVCENDIHRICEVVRDTLGKDRK
jgi:dTDP-4-amino-4,6-dideoxygalactose transaminase